jgi:hypothetical protein
VGAILSALIGAATVSRTSSTRGDAQATAAEPLLSYELDRLFRAGRRNPTVDLSAERAEAGRILLTTSSHSGLSSDDRGYLVQLVGSLTGLSSTDAERRVDNAIASAKTAITRILGRYRGVAWRCGGLGRCMCWRTTSGRSAPARLDGPIGCGWATARVLVRDL